MENCTDILYVEHLFQTDFIFLKLIWWLPRLLLYVAAKTSFWSGIQLVGEVQKLISLESLFKRTVFEENRFPDFLQYIFIKSYFVK